MALALAAAAAAPRHITARHAGLTVGDSRTRVALPATLPCHQALPYSGTLETLGGIQEGIARSVCRRGTLAVRCSHAEAGNVP